MGDVFKRPTSISSFHHPNSPNEIVEHKLKSICQLCLKDDTAKDMIRQSHGLDMMINYLFSITNLRSLETLLVTLGCCAENNPFNQKILSQIRIFQRIQTLILNQKPYFVPVVLKSLYMLSCIMDQNSHGQNLIKKSGLLADLTTLSENIFPSLITDHNEVPSVNRQHKVMVWQFVISIIATSVNNPQNEKNQLFCSSLFPFLLDILKNNHKFAFKSTSLLLSNCLSNHPTNQKIFNKLEGFSILKMLFLNDYQIRALQYENWNHNLKENALALLNIVDAAIIDNQENTEHMLFNGIFHQIIALIQEADKNDEMLMPKLLLVLCHCLDSNVAPADLDSLKPKLADLSQTVTDDDLKLLVSYIVKFVTPNTGRSQNGTTLPYSSALHSPAKSTSTTTISLLKRFESLKRIDTLRLQTSWRNSNMNKTSGNFNLTDIQPQYTHHNGFSKLDLSSCNSYCQRKLMSRKFSTGDSLASGNSQNTYSRSKEFNISERECSVSSKVKKNGSIPPKSQPSVTNSLYFLERKTKAFKDSFSENGLNISHQKKDRNDRKIPSNAVEYPPKKKLCSQSLRSVPLSRKCQPANLTIEHASQSPPPLHYRTLQHQCRSCRANLELLLAMPTSELAPRYPKYNFHCSRCHSSNSIIERSGSPYKLPLDIANTMLISKNIPDDQIVDVLH